LKQYTESKGKGYNYLWEKRAASKKGRLSNKQGKGNSEGKLWIGMQLGGEPLGSHHQLEKKRK